jgi:hypothetical protein
MPHSAFRGQTPDEVFFGTAPNLAAELVAARAKARELRLATNRSASCGRCTTAPEPTPTSQISPLLQVWRSCIRICSECCRSQYRCRASITSNRRRRGRRSSGPSRRRRCGTCRPPPTLETAGGGLTRCRTTAGSPSTGSRSSAGRRCQPARAGHQLATDLRARAKVVPVATAPRISTPRRERLRTWPSWPVEIMPGNAPQRFNMFREVLSMTYNQQCDAVGGH